MVFYNPNCMSEYFDNDHNKICLFISPVLLLELNVLNVNFVDVSISSVKERNIQSFSTRDLSYLQCLGYRLNKA